MFALGIDVGSTNVKVAVVDDEGGLRASSSRPLVTVVDGEVATQDASALIEAVLDAACEALAVAGPAAAAEVATIGVCSQYSSTVGVDRDARPVTPLVMYLDQRGAEHCWAILDRHPEAFGTWVEHHGIPPVGAGLSLAHLLALQIDDPATHEGVTSYLEVMDLVNAALTGRIVANRATMFTSQLCDNRMPGIAGYDPELLVMSGVDPTRLPELAALDEPVGTLGQEAAARLGLDPAVVVQAGMNDTHAGAFATGVFEGGNTGLMIGTTAVILDELDRPASDLEREVVTMPSPMEGRYLVMAENGLAGRPVAHVLEQLLGGPGSNADAFGELAAACAASAPGAGGVMFLPWLAGSLSPSSDPNMRGGFLGMGLDTTRADMLRATLEGTGRNLRWLMPAVLEMTGRPPEEITFGGGAARSRAWAQCISDVLGVPLRLLEQPESAVARAVALVALARHGGGDPSEVALPVADRVEPDPVAADLHDRAQELFEQCFVALQPISGRLHP